MKITKSIKALVGSVALLAIAYAVAHAAALNSQPVGSILSCGLSRFSCTATISTLTGPASFTTTAVTFPTFQVAALGTAPSSVALRLAPGVTPPWQGTGSSPTLGSVTWQFDLSRVAPNTTITANTLVADFPATAHIRAHITGTIAAYPGVTARFTHPDGRILRLPA